MLAVALLFLLPLGVARAQGHVQLTTLPGLPSPLPEPFTVMPFENRSGIVGLEWMRLAVPFVLAERAEGFARLRPVYDDLVVSPVPAGNERTTPTDVANFAAQDGASWVFTGWIRRPDWTLELGVSLYRVQAGQASLVAEYVGLGEFKDVHALVGTALRETAAKAQLGSKGDDSELLDRVSSTDFYAFTLFGRALGATLTATTSAEIDKAGQTMLRAVFIEPTFTEAQRMVARDQRRRHKPLLAKVRLETVLAARPNYAAALTALASSARDHHQLSLATEVREKLVKLRPWDLEARYELGMLYWALDRSPEAFAQLTIVADQQPGHIRARRALVLIHAKRSDTASLIRELRAVAKLAPEDVDTQLELGAALVAADSTVEAIDVYKRIIELDELNVQALKFLGDLYQRQGQTQRAIRHYGLAIQAAPKDPRSYFLLGAMYVSAGQDLEARRIYLKAQRFAKWRGEAYNNLGAIELRRDRVAQGVWYLRRAVQREAQRAGYRYNLALALSKTRAADEALEQIDAALALEPDSPESHYLRGVVLLRLGRAEEARGAFQATLAITPEHADASHNLSLLDAMKKRATEGAVVVEGR